MRKTLRNNSRRTKSKEPKHCAIMDKPCMGEKCALHYDMFGKCSLELIPYNMYPLTVAIQELVEINHDLLEMVKELARIIRETDGKQQLFT